MNILKPFKQVEQNDSTHKSFNNIKTAVAIIISFQYIIASFNLKLNDFKTKAKYRKYPLCNQNKLLYA